MKNKLLFVLFSLLFFPGFSLAGNSKEILVVGKIIYKPYEDTVKGFVEGSGQKVEVFNTYGYRKREILKKVYTVRPDLVVAVGNEALDHLREIRDIPVFSLLGMPQRIFREKSHISGTSLEVTPYLQLKSLRRAFPSIKRVGMIYSPQQSQSFLTLAQQAADEFGFTLIMRSVEDARKFPRALEELRKDIEIFWMTPDEGTITPETIDFLFDYAISTSMPVMSYSRKYTSMGAVLAVTINAEETGRQASKDVDAILQKTYRDDHGYYAKNATITFNLTVLERLELEADLQHNNTMEVIE